MSDIQNIIQELIAFRDARDWSQFHNAKDLALAISIEAGELNELFLWKSASEARAERVKEELADILSFALLLADKYEFDVATIIKEKIAQNDKKYPVEKAKGNATKYTDL
jgi:NTP pyrophosphatase (non-canonical NTP hydrolase)